MEISCILLRLVVFFIIIVIIISIIILIIIIILWSHVGGCDVLITVVCGGWNNCICKQITNALTARDHIIRSFNCCGPGVACTITEKVVTTSYSTKLYSFKPNSKMIITPTTTIQHFSRRGSTPAPERCLQRCQMKCPP